MLKARTCTLHTLYAVHLNSTCTAAPLHLWCMTCMLLTYKVPCILICCCIPGVPAATITMPLRPLQGMWLLMPSSNVSSTSALAAQGAAAGLSTALAAGRLTTLYAKVRPFQAAVCASNVSVVWPCAVGCGSAHCCVSRKNTSCSTHYTGMHFFHVRCL